MVSAFAQEQDEIAPELLKKADEIVRKLGDEKYREREKATFELSEACGNIVLCGIPGK